MRATTRSRVARHVIPARLRLGAAETRLVTARYSCQGMVLDTLTSRERQVALLERYGALLTEHQQQVLDLYLRQDWSLAEVAAHQETSRSAVHDLVRRATATLEEHERRLGLLADQARRRDARSELVRELAELRRRLARVETALEQV